MIQVPEELKNIVARFSKDECAMVVSAYQTAASRLAGRVRGNDHPFIEHPLGVASIISEIWPVASAVTAVFLHEANRFEANNATDLNKSALLTSFRGQYPQEIIDIVISLNKIAYIKLQETNLDEERYRKLIISYSSDPQQVILIKLADRLEVMRNLSILPASKQKAKIMETILLYVPLAHQIGLYWVQKELEDLFLKFSEPEQYRSITNHLKATERDREKLVTKFIMPLKDKLDSRGIKYEFKIRTKSAYSIWKKMQAQHVTFEGIYDVFAIRFIIDSPPDRETEHKLCWEVFSLVNSVYTPDTKRLRDWLSFPKPNGYESLHATVTTDEGRTVEVQIRTARMDYIAEMGHASHSSYKGIKSEEWMNGYLNSVRENLKRVSMAATVHNAASDKPIAEKYEAASEMTSGVTSSASSGTTFGIASGAAPSANSGAASGAVPSAISGAASEKASKITSGATQGASYGATSGAASGAVPSAISGAASEKATATASGADLGTASEATSGADSGADSGATSEKASEIASCATSGTSSTHESASKTEPVASSANDRYEQFSPLVLNEIFVFTPTGDLRQLPLGATLLDFAFEIHTNLGIKCSGGTVNGKMVPIREKLKTGDVVDIISNKNQKPSPDWLNIVVTSKARNKIKQKLKEEEYKRANLGKEILDRRLKNWKLVLNDEDLAILVKKYKFKTINEFYGAIGSEDINAIEIKEYLSNKNTVTAAVVGVEHNEHTSETSYASDYLVIDGKLDNVDYKMAKCCNPIFGDEVFGFVTVKEGIKIHRMSCPNASRLIENYPYRIQKVRWKESAGKSSFQVAMRVLVDGDMSVMNSVISVVNGFRSSIRSISANESIRGSYEINMQLFTPSNNELDKIIAALKRIREVKQVTRL